MIVLMSVLMIGLMIALMIALAGVLSIEAGVFDDAFGSHVPLWLNPAYVIQ